MPFTRPTRTGLADQARAEIDARLSGADSRLRRSILDTLARVLAGGLYGLYSFLDWGVSQMFPDTAATENIERWASLYGFARTVAVASQGDVDFTGTNASIVPAGSILNRADGTTYTTDAIATIASGVATAAVTASVVGVGGDAVAGVALTTQSTIPGVNSAVVVATGGLVSGADAQSDESLRETVITRMREPPHGGAQFDYDTWVKVIPGITRVWVESDFATNPGELTVYFVLDGFANIFPSAGQLLIVSNILEPVRPVTAKITVAHLVQQPIDFTISVEPDTAEVRAAVIAELKSLLTREAVPGGTIKASRISEAISKATGETSHTITVPSADIVSSAGNLAYQRNFTWV